MPLLWLAVRWAFFFSPLVASWFFANDLEQRSGAPWTLIPLAFVAWFALGTAMFLGHFLRISDKRVYLVSAAYLLAMLASFVLPTHPREVFKRDVGRIQVGMSRGEVEAIMAEHVVGADVQFPGFDDIVSRRHPGATYYEARGEHHPFDNNCLVWFEEDRVVRIRLHED